ncbi:MAG: trypsin-like peptidase domain-containing protein [Actinomycetota bacterium]
MRGSGAGEVPDSGDEPLAGESHDDDEQPTPGPLDRGPTTPGDEISPSSGPDDDAPLDETDGAAALTPEVDPIDEITAEYEALDLDDDDDDAEWLGLPLPMEDRLWRHPSELRYEAPVPAAAGSGRGGSWLTLVGVAVGAGLLGAFVSAMAMRSLTGDPETVVERRIETPRSIPTVFSGTDVVDVAERVSPGVARIVVRRSGDERATGSGVLFRSDGLVLTNAHVVRDAVEVNVTLADGSEHDASIVGIDSLTDIAVIDLDGTSLPTVALATEPQLAVGQTALAIGSPLGLDGGPTVTLGVISALGRDLESPSGLRLYDLIQTDAPIAPGSSGGALVDANGALIGITTAIGVSDVGAEGLGFATPIGIAYDVAIDLLDDGRVEHAWLGITGTERSDEGVVVDGVEIMTVTEGGPAGVAGLEPGDVIISADGNVVPTMSHLIGVLRRSSPGATIPLELASGVEVRVELGVRPDLPDRDGR